jgi:hypothetical protein
VASPRAQTSTHTLLRAAASSCALAGGIAVGCLAELPRGRSCGDGWWDPEFEECDRSSNDRSYLAACGEGSSSTCDPNTCELRCTPIETCGNGVVDSDEECDPAFSCASVEECGVGANLACSFYETEALGIDKPYASGTVRDCTEYCFFGRNHCSFCGDGMRDGSYDDLVYPSGNPATFPAEICDGDEAQPDALEAHCVSLCTPEEPVNADVVVSCAFECKEKCDGFIEPENPGDPAEHDCCLAKGSPCPDADFQGVPDLPCCSWLEHPEWSCVTRITEQGAKAVCP